MLLNMQAKAADQAMLRPPRGAHRLPRGAACPHEQEDGVSRIATSSATRAIPLASPSSSCVLGVAAAGAGALTLLIRLALHGRAFDLFGDEVIYTDLGRSVLSGGFPRFFGTIFFLHGPGFFYLESAWAQILGSPSNLMSWVYEMRTLNAFLAAATAVALVLLTSRVSSRRVGIAVGILFALDPFCIRQNDRVLLETAMMMWVVLGYLGYSSLVGLPKSRNAIMRALGAGLLFGCAILTKDEAALLTILPLLAAAVLRWGPRRTFALITIGTTAAVYTCYLTVVAANGYFDVLWQAKTTGVKRLLGLVQITGFHSSGGGSLTARLVAEGGYFLTTYIVLVAGLPALIIVLRRGGQLPRLVGLLHCAAGVTLCYALAFGTLEEQELYLLVIPSLVTVPMAVATLRYGKRARRVSAPWRKKWAWPRVVLGAAFTLMVGANVVTCIQWARHPDDGFALLLPYMAAHVPPGTAVTVAAGSPPPSQTDGGRYALESMYKVGLWTTAAAIRQENLRYVMVEWGPIDEGYSYLKPPAVRRLVQGDQLVFSFQGRTYGQLDLYKLPSPDGRARARH
jgi:Dolichyl-phosphate-mannose-protein mannosyltransferase